MADPRSPNYEYSPVAQGKGKTEPKVVHVGTSSVTPSLTEKNAQAPAQRPGWTSTYLQNVTLLSFAFAFLTLLLAVIALAVVDAKQDGIANAKSSEHYLWTYGPTAVLVIVAAFWNQVEYRTKHAQPWVLLQQKPTPASRTLFMDYITPGKPEALWTSLRRSHWPVAITIVNSFLITLLTVSSTGLLMLQSTPFVRYDCRLNVTDDFATSFDISTTNSAPVLATLAIQNGTIPFPPGTSRNSAFQNLAPPTFLSGFDGVEIEGLTSTFYGGLQCETATVKSGYSGCSDRQCHSFNTSLDITTPTCEIRGYNLTWACPRSFNATSCSMNRTWGIGCDRFADGYDQNRLILMYGDLKQDLVSATKNGTNPTELDTGKTTTIVCEAKYNITGTQAVMDHDGNLKNNPRPATTTARVQQFPAYDLVDALLTACDAAGIVLDGSYSYWAWSSDPWSAVHRLFERMFDATCPSSDRRDPNVLQSCANEVFSMVTAQMVKQNLMRPSTDTTIGICRGTEDRLRVRGVSLYLMGAVLVLLMLSTIGLLYVAPRAYSSRDPSSIGGLALVLSQSPALLSRLSSSGSVDLKTMRTQMDKVECQTLLTQKGQKWQFAIDLSSTDVSEEQHTTPDAAPRYEPTYWRPVSLRPLFKSLVIVALLILVVLLEVLYSISQKNDGLTEVDPQGNQRFAWVYVPAIVMITAQTLVGMIAFSSLMIFPYFHLRSGKFNTRSDVLQNYASETAIKSLWRSAAARHVIVASMALAMLLTPLLTIAVSGLYTAQATSTQIPVTLSVRDQMNSSFITRDISVMDDQGLPTSANNIGLLLSQNFTFPRWTYDELAFPEATLEIPPTVNISTLPRGNITVMLPGLRSDLNCSVAAAVPTNFTDILGDRFRKANVTGWEPFNKYGTIYSDLSWPNPGENPFGFFQSCGNEDYRDKGSTFCGALGTSEVNWNAFTCSSILNQLDVELTIDVSTLTIIAAAPDESTVRFFSNQTVAPGDLSDWPSSMIPALFGSANFRDAVAGYYDPAFQAVVWGLGTHDSLDNFPMKEYMSNDGFEKVAKQLKHVHRTLTAQSANMIRIPLNTSSPLAPPASVNATLINPNIYRLHQSAISTRILDGLLIAIALCIALSFFLMDTREVLPKNPASIAAGASLVAADARMLQSDILPEGAQWYSDAELEEKKVWDGLFFRLGWWDSEGPSEQGGQGKNFKVDTI
ncbi:hypothetical protein SVAN01_04803 [Stagonosporopsis vannaccii]|nr:hypothetical protein SVAN01_04803 [Stagonosporopsis vannaccii]